MKVFLFSTFLLFPTLSFSVSSQKVSQKQVKCNSYYKTNIHSTVAEILTWLHFGEFSISKQEKLLEKKYDHAVKEATLVKKLIERKKLFLASERLSKLLNREITKKMLEEENLDDLLTSISISKDVIVNIENDYSIFNLKFNSKVPFSEDPALIDPNKFVHALAFELKNKVTKTISKYEHYIARDQLYFGISSDDLIGTLSLDVNKLNIKHATFGGIQKVIVTCHYKVEPIPFNEKVSLVEQYIQRLQKKLTGLNKLRNDKSGNIITTPVKTYQNPRNDSSSGQSSGAR